MESSVKIMKAVGIIHIIHGVLMFLVSIALAIITMSYFINMISWLLFVALVVGLSFLYIYVGYELFSLRNPDKMRNLLIASIILACVEIIASTVEGKMIGMLFIAEFIMSIIAICNISSYRRSKK